MTIYTVNGTFVEQCSDWTGEGSNGCWNGGLSLSTDYYALIQGYGWSTGAGGGVRIDFTTAAAYATSNYHDAAHTPGYMYDLASATDGTVWY